MPITGIKISPSVRKNIYGTRTNPSNSIWNNANEIWGSWTLEGEWDGDIDAFFFAPTKINVTPASIVKV